MAKLLKNLSFKFRFLLPVAIAVFTSITIITIVSVKTSKNAVYELIKQNSISESHDINNLLNQEYFLAIKNNETDLKVIRRIFFKYNLYIDSLKSDTVKSILNENKVTDMLPFMYLSKNKILNNNNLADSILNSNNQLSAIYQKTDSGYFKVLSNELLNYDSSIITDYYGNNHNTIKKLEEKRYTISREFTRNGWFTCTYQLFYFKGKTAGFFCNGSAEIGNDKLQNLLSTQKVGNHGNIMAISNMGNTIIYKNFNNFPDSSLYNRIINYKINQPDTVYSFLYNNQYLVTAQLFEPYQIKVFTLLNIQTESEQLIKNISNTAIIIGISVVILFILFIFLITAETYKQYLYKEKKSKEQLLSAREALIKTEIQYRYLFDNSSDEIFITDTAGNILEVNSIACETLEYTYKQLLNLRFKDTVSHKYKLIQTKNFQKILTTGNLIYESEQVTKNNKIIPVEIKSRLINYQNMDIIMNIARDITQRVAMEKKILKTIIETEEQERRRLAIELHDGLGPILSTIKLYTSLLSSSNNAKISNTELIENITELSQLAISTAKEISHNLTPAVLDDFGLPTAIAEFASYINKTKKVNVITETSEYTLKNGGFFENILYQAIKELINNSLKHANPTNITIDLKNNSHQIILYYADNGTGFNVPEMLKNAKGLGIKSIVNKIKTIKGTCDFYSEPDKGMRVIIVLKPETNE